MSNTGIAFDGTETTFTAENEPSSELEISPNGQLMAWSVGDVVYLYNIGASWTPITLEGIVSGLEFSHDSQFLLASVEGQGIAVISVDPPNNHTYIPNSSNFGKTYIEAGKDGKMYCVHRNGNLYEIWPDLNTMMATELTVYSNEPGIANMTRGGYTLPDQIDGEGDEFFYNVPPLIITDLTIEALSIPQAVGGVVPAFYNCDNIDLSVDYSGQATDYMVRIYSVDPVTGIQVFGSPFLDYTGTFSGAPPAFIDLRCIDDPVNCDLFDDYLTQTFAVEIRLDGACTKRARLGYFRVFGAPANPADIKLQINAGNGPICSASHNPATPCTAGLFSGAVSLSNSNGDITFYRIDIDETDCTTGTVIQNLYSGPATQVSSIPALVFGFNSFEINGSTGYFILNNFLNRCIRVSAEVGNNCGSSTDFSYVLFNGAYRYGDPDRFNISNDAATLSADDTGNASMEAAQQGNEGEALRTVLVFPNPARDAWQFQFSGPLPGPGNITLTDAIGRTLRVLRVDAGAIDFSISAENLPNGVYYYRINTEKQPIAGILVKD
ncbi:MAG: T9SS type A sorting domain-containing protein [Saprospiraceae bacterium]|nr:T9SS type A sorting domain-containing protein [Saprospiraceae bacterium]